MAHKEISRHRSYFHLFAWAFPLVLFVAIVAMSQVCNALSVTIDYPIPIIIVILHRLMQMASVGCALLAIRIRTFLWDLSSLL